jgi:SAM-dependent methyltransferase
MRNGLQFLRDITRPARRRIARALYNGGAAASNESPSSGETRDDFDWATYRADYERDLVEVARDHTQKLSDGDFSFEDGHISLRPGLKPLHPNHACLYESIRALSPSSVIEMGCGGGDHLHNLGVLYPAIARRGFDRSPGQLALLRERSPDLAGLVSELDVTLPPGSRYPSADLVYTQAVVMHVHAGNGHLVALANMFRMARRHVVLMENWWRHWFMDDIAMLHRGGMIDWPTLNFYFRRYNGSPLCMVISKDALQLERLDDYATLLDAMAWQPPPGTYPNDGRYRPKANGAAGPASPS